MADIPIPMPDDRAPVAPSAPEPAPAAPEAQAAMTLVDHLGELRTRIFRSVLAVGLGSVLGFIIANPIIKLLSAPVGGRLLNLAPGDAFFIHVRVAVVVGVILAHAGHPLPAVGFVAPGLTAEERRSIRPWVPIALVFFALGCVIAYVVLPYAMAFLMSFDQDVFENKLAAAPYFDFVTTLFLAFGLVMEFPIVLYALARVNIVNSARLRSSRRYVILGITIFATVVTPGGDIVSPLVLGLTMYLLYESTTWFIARGGR